MSQGRNIDIKVKGEDLSEVPIVNLAAKLILAGIEVTEISVLDDEGHLLYTEMYTAEYRKSVRDSNPDEVDETFGTGLPFDQG